VSLGFFQEFLERAAYVRSSQIVQEYNLGGGVLLLRWNALDIACIWGFHLTDGGPE